MPPACRGRGGGQSDHQDYLPGEAVTSGRPADDGYASLAVLHMRLCASAGCNSQELALRAGWTVMWFITPAFGACRADLGQHGSMAHDRKFRFAAQLSKAPDGTAKSWAEQERKAEDLGYSTLSAPPTTDSLLTSHRHS